MNRIDQKFKDLRKKKQKALICFITAGDPDLSTTAGLVLGLEQAGVDLIELGVPFSDPLADGLTIQKSSQRALSGGTTLSQIMRMVVDLRKKTDIPLILMGYYNPILRYGLKRFVQTAARIGIDGLIVVDLTPEESAPLRDSLKGSGLDLIFLLAPTSPPQRIRLVSRLAQGFIYYVSLTGTTGAREKLPQELEKGLAKIRLLTSKPIAVGFGISTPRQAKRVSGIADGIILGSAVINIMEKTPKKQVIPAVQKFVRSLKKSLS